MGQSLFELHDIAEHTNAIADYLPNGLIFGSKYVDGSILRAFLESLAPEFQRAEQTLIETSKQHDINCAVDFISLWESAVGIPDDCFPATGTLLERQTHVICKLAGMNVQTEQDFIDLADKLGFTITISSLSDSIFPPYDIPMIPVDGDTARFIWLVTGVDPGSVPPYDIPLALTFTSSIIICVFELLKPAMTRIIFLA